MSDTSLEKVDKAADRIRDELFATLRELDRRRHEVANWRAQLQSHRQLVMVAGAAIGAGLLGLVGFVAYRIKTRDERIRRAKRRGLKRAFEHPERLAVEKQSQRPLLQEIARKAAVIAATTLAAQAARGAGQKFVYQKPKTI